MKIGMIPALAALVFLSGAAAAHEFWLEPLKYRLAPGETIEARAINGERFAGREFSYSAPGFSQSGVVAGKARVTPIPGNSGTRPAVRVSPADEGLNILYFASSMNMLTYPKMEKFESFLRGKHLEHVLPVHKQKGLPDTDIREAYFRMVKALVAVGNGAGEDRFVGLPFELVAKANPYTSRGDIPVQLLRGGKPVADYPLYVFRRNGDTVTKIDLKTDGSGRAVVPRGPGGEFMVNAVEISEPSDKIKEIGKAHWQTLWAALTYEIGG